MQTRKLIAGFYPDWAMTPPVSIPAKIKNEERSQNVIYNQQIDFHAAASPVSWSAAGCCCFCLLIGHSWAGKTQERLENANSSMETRPSISLTPQSARSLLPRVTQSSKKLKSNAGMWPGISSLIKPIPSPVWARTETRNLKVETGAVPGVHLVLSKFIIHTSAFIILNSYFILQSSSFLPTWCTLTAGGYGI